MILLNDFKRQWAETGADVLASVRQAGESGWYILGDNVAAFERELAAFWGFGEAVGVASGLDALEMSLRVLECRPGDRVLTTSISAFATVLAILRIGAVPVFADCGENGLVDLESCRRVLENNRDIAFFIPVHLYGHSLDRSELLRLRNDFGLRIVEDCAQSIGALSNGVPTGSVGDIAATSFYPTKNLGAMGDGGAVLTNNLEYAAKVRVLRDYGQTSKYVHQTIGYNSRLDEVQAAILRRAYLPRLHDWTLRRREIARKYRENIRNPFLCVPREPSGSTSCYHLFPVLAIDQSKPGFMAHLKAHGIMAGEHYPAPMPDQPAMRDIPVAGESDRARQFCHCEVSLPIHPFLTREEVEHVITACNDWKP